MPKKIASKSSALVVAPVVANVAPLAARVTCDAMTAPMVDHLNAMKCDLATKQKIAALYLQLKRDESVTANKAKAIRRTLRSLDFHISDFKGATSALVADALAFATSK